jgi:UDP-glucuronate 4-epimerase
MILVTGAAGFIGFHLSKQLLSDGHEIIGIDNMNEYYDPTLKKNRLKILQENKRFLFNNADICNYSSVEDLFKKHKIKKICHLAAQAGVRYSLSHPHVYQKSNGEGFLNILELARYNNIENFVYASSSSVYGTNSKTPFSESDPVEHPISIYAATKRSNELVAHSYSHLFGIPCSGLRFFTVYGPWGRPDMALFIFTRSIINNEPISIFNNGNMIRNFTYVDDIVDGIVRVLNNPLPYEIYNIGNSRAETLLDFVNEIEKNLGKKAIRNYLPLQPGDVPNTIADIEKLKKLGYEPKTNIDIGIKNFVNWYMNYYT